MRRVFVTATVVLALGVAQAALASPAGPAGGPVPAGTAATSVTFISPNTAFVLGTAPCVQPPCSVILRTRDRGASWVGLPAPRERVSYRGGRGLWGLRFADATHGYAFGDGLWVTSDGAASWHRARLPEPFVMDFAAVRDRELVALMAPCQLGGMHCSDSLALYHRPISGGTWRRVARAGTAFEEGIAVHGRVVWVLMGKTLLRSGDSGRTFTAHSVPCPRGHATLPVPESITDDGAHAYVLCVGQGFTGHTIKFVYRTARTPSGWKLAGRPPTAGDSGELAAGSDKAVVLATASAASWLDRSRDAGQRWSTVLNDADGGEGWSDLGFTTATDGVVIHGPAITDGGDSGHPGQLLLTDDGGVTWRLVTF